MREEKTEVLVVGAGPVGLLTGLLLAKEGVGASIIDADIGRAAKSYACCLHPRTLELLGHAGLVEDVLELGRRIETIAFFDGASRRAEIRLSGLTAPYPFAVVLPQNALESVMEQHLQRGGRLKVNWNHRLSDLQTEAQGVVATIDHLGATSKGYIVPHWETVVEGTSRTRANFLVGADGHSSTVRRLLGIKCKHVASSAIFEVFEFEPERSSGTEARVVLDRNSVNVLWPLSDARCRWSFQKAEAGEERDFPMKDRSAVILDDPGGNREFQLRLREYVQERAPWFEAGVRGIEWSSHVQFHPQLAECFGRDRCWLAGDAAHQAGPVGAQSMNVGLAEANNLAGLLKKVLREQASMELLKVYDRARQNEWEQLFGLKGGLRPRKDTDPWVKENCDRMLPCIPASGADLIQLAGQLGLDFP